MIHHAQKWNCFPAFQQCLKASQNSQVMLEDCVLKLEGLLTQTAHHQKRLRRAQEWDDFGMLAGCVNTLDGSNSCKISKKSENGEDLLNFEWFGTISHLAILSKWLLLTFFFHWVRPPTRLCTRDYVPRNKILWEKESNLFLKETHWVRFWARHSFT